MTATLRFALGAMEMAKVPSGAVVVVGPSSQSASPSFTYVRIERDASGTPFESARVPATLTVSPDVTRSEDAVTVTLVDSLPAPITAAASRLTERRARYK